MTLSAELQQRYSSEVDYDWWEALILSHSAAGTYYLANAQDGQSRQGMLDGDLRTFLPIPFEAVLPRRDGEGQQDLQIAICNVGAEMTTAVEEAITVPTEPIRARYTVYIEGNTAPQYDPPLELSLTDIILTEAQMSATATRYNVFNKPFPGVIYRPDSFPGLNRR